MVKRLQHAITVLGIVLWAMTGLTLVAQQSFLEQSLVLNVEVPVRVFKQHRFVDHLTLEDFELWEDGVPQRIEAVYLVQDGKIRRKHEKTKLLPDTSRHLFLFLEVHQYSARFKESLEYFVREVILPRDSFYIVTPQNTYKLKDQALEVLSKDKIERQLVDILRKDTHLGNFEYKRKIDRLSSLAAQLTAALSGGEERSPGDSFEEGDGFDDSRALQELLMQYQSEYAGLETLREISQMKLLDFARFLKQKPGQKYVYFMYQKEFLPVIDPKILTQYMNLVQEHHDVMQNLTDLFNLNIRQTAIDVSEVKKAYADSSISIQFLFITMPPQQVSGIKMEEHSEDIFSSWREIALATGGFTGSSSRPELLLPEAVSTADNYYLIYYTPKNLDYSDKRKFRNISVKVTENNCKVMHRIGYYEY